MKKMPSFLLLIFSLFFGSVVSAQINTLPFTVSPARQQITINPGEEAQIAVKFYNQSETAIAGFIKIADFVVEDDKGTPRIIEDINQASPRFAASNWFILPFDRMSIAANDKTIIQTTLKVPEDARPGGRYVAVFFEPTSPFAAPVGESGASIVPRIASLLYIRVNGPITENAYISNLFSKSFYEYGPIDVSAQIVNKGDYHIRPRGTFTLTNVFGGLVSQAPLSEANIFPDAIRTFQSSLGKKWMIGRYKLTLSASYGEKGQVMERSLYLWVFPWKIVTVVVLALIILFALGKGLYKNTISKEASLEQELEREREEIDKLKEELKKRD